jgi:hypothetical protein
VPATTATLIPDPANPDTSTVITRLVQMATPPVDAVGIVATITVTRLDGVVITDPAPPFDIVKGVTEVGGFTFQETAL